MIFTLSFPKWRFYFDVINGINWRKSCVRDSAGLTCDATVNVLS
jgi:hypothetical protein